MLYNASLVEDNGEPSKLPFVCLRIANGHKVLALVDTGASISILSHESAKRMGLPILASRLLTISGYSKTTTERSNIYQVTIITELGPVQVILAGAPTLPKTQFLCPRLSSNDLKFIRDQKLDTEVIRYDQNFNGRHIDLILGNDIIPYMLGRSKRVLLPSQRYIEYTPFAPIIFPSPRIHSLASITEQVTIVEDFLPETISTVLVKPSEDSNPDESLRTEIAQLWNLENLGIEEPGPTEGQKMRVKDLVAEFEKKVRKDDLGDLMVSLPWNGKQSRLASNRGVAGKRLEQLINSLNKGNNLLEQYDEIIQTQIKSGIIEMVTPSMNNSTDPLYYIPHRVVVKMSSHTTKLRIVLDASSKKTGELSLNDCLDPGPSMLVDLYEILIRSRMSKFLVVADIEKAFHQVRLVPEDRNCTRFLWLKDIRKPPMFSNIIEFRFTRIPFGMTCSPFLLAAYINHFLDNSRRSICQRIKENIYVDNIMITTDDKDEIQEIRQESKSEFVGMNMNLREFITNCPEEMAKFPREEIAAESTIKLLGYSWNTIEDKFTIKLARLLESRPTKRQVASRMAETFDPLGLVCPLLVLFKLLIKDLWEDGILWKSPIAKKLLPKWEVIRCQFSEESISVPRLIRPNAQYERLKLAVFSDASKDTYACAVYAQYELADGRKEVGLLTAKSKIKPSGCTTLTIPRLELLAVEMGTRMVRTVVKAVHPLIPCSIHFFTDSMVALYWILKGEQVKCWVHNRVKEVHEAADSLKTSGSSVFFHHCPTDKNPADIATRGMGSSELKGCTLWFKGPQFLQDPPNLWPCRIEGDVSCPSDFRALVSSEMLVSKKKSKTPSNEVGEESEPKFFELAEALNGMCMTIDIDEKYESFVPYSRSNSLSRVISYTHSTLTCLAKLFKKHKWEGAVMKKFVSLQGDTSDLSWTLKRRAIARQLVITEHYKEAASKGLEFPKSVEPTKGPDGIFRVYRRVPSPVLLNETYKLILIHRKHTLARLIVTETHIMNVHLPATYLVSSLRTRYWIPADKQLADSVVRSCVQCQKVNNKPFEYPYAKRLPKFRTTPSVPFQHVGLDYAGPITYLCDDGLSTDKAYILIYTCLVTRATHVELLPDGTTRVYLQGLKNIFARRGVPASIYSDNAATFSLGAKIISDNMSRYVPSTSMTCFLATHQIDFRTITPLAPWQGGIYERVVGIVKHQMHKELGGLSTSFFNLSNVLIQVEAMINSRPLTPNPREVRDLPALRPIDFILPSVLIEIPSERDSAEDHQPFDPTRDPTITERRTLQHQAEIDTVLERLWEIWTNAYLSFLRENAHAKHRSSTIVPRIGQVVLIKVEKLARHNWPLGVIKELIRSKDGKTRTASVRCNGAIYSRAVNLLIPLELEMSDPYESDESKHYICPPDPPGIAQYPIAFKPLRSQDTSKDIQSLTPQRERDREESQRSSLMEEKSLELSRSSPIAKLSKVVSFKPSEHDPTSDTSGLKSCVDSAASHSPLISASRSGAPDSERGTTMCSRNESENTGFRVPSEESTSESSASRSGALSSTEDLTSSDRNPLRSGSSPNISASRSGAHDSDTESTKCNRNEPNQTGFRVPSEESTSESSASRSGALSSTEDLTSSDRNPLRSGSSPNISASRSGAHDSDTESTKCNRNEPNQTGFRVPSEVSISESSACRSGALASTEDLTSSDRNSFIIGSSPNINASRSGASDSEKESTKCNRNETENAGFRVPSEVSNSESSAGRSGALTSTEDLPSSDRNSFRNASSPNISASRSGAHDSEKQTPTCARNNSNESGSIIPLDKSNLKSCASRSGAHAEMEDIQTGDRNSFKSDSSPKVSASRSGAHDSEIESKDNYTEDNSQPNKDPVPQEPEIPKRKRGRPKGSGKKDRIHPSKQPQDLVASRSGATSSSNLPGTGQPQIPLNHRARTYLPRTAKSNLPNYVEDDSDL